MDPAHVTRLEYLFKTFLSRVLPKSDPSSGGRRAFSGLSDPRHSTLRLLLLLSAPSHTTEHPTLFPEVKEAVEQQPYLTREEYLRRLAAEEAKEVNSEWTLED